MDNEYWYSGKVNVPAEQREQSNAGDVVRKVSLNDLDNKNVLGNEGHLQIKRLYAVFANKKLRNKYFGF